MTGVPVRLAPEHDRTAFDSGEPTLDRWLREQAGQSDRKDGARTYVVCDGDRVVGYYTLCAFSVDPATAPKPERIGRHPIPAVLLARLAVDSAYQGGGLGSALLVDALSVSARVADRVGARLVVVHALHDRAARYYARAGFRPFAGDPLTLYLRMVDVRRTLGDLG